MGTVYKETFTKPLPIGGGDSRGPVQVAVCHEYQVKPPELGEKVAIAERCGPKWRRSSDGTARQLPMVQDMVHEQAAWITPTLSGATIPPAANALTCLTARDEGPADDEFLPPCNERGWISSVIVPSCVGAVASIRTPTARPVDEKATSCYNACMSTKRREPLSTQLRRLAKESGESLTELSRATGLHKSALSRFLNGERGLSMEGWDALGAHLGLRLTGRGSREKET